MTVCIKFTVVTGTQSPGRKFGLRLFKPIAQRLLKKRAKLNNSEAENNSAGN